MGGEGGQASVEWVGALLLVAIALGALARLSDRVDATALATAGLETTRCALAGCESRERDAGSPRRAVVLPPPLPPPPPGGQPGRLPGGRPSSAPGDGDAGATRRPFFRLRNPIPPRARAGLGAAWRRAWVACFAYERIRYGLLHRGDHRQVVPLSEVARMANDCLSPFDLSRDWEHLRP